MNKDRGQMLHNSDLCSGGVMKWYTRTLEVRMLKDMEVQVLSPAPVVTFYGIISV